MELNTVKKMNTSTLSLDDFMKKIYEDSKGKHDYNVNSSQLKMDAKGRLITKPLEDSEGLNLEFDSLGFEHMCQKMDTPDLVKYGQRLYDMGQTARLSSLFNFHLDDYTGRTGEKDLWVRSKEGKCRAVFTDKYGIYDNDLVAENIHENFKNKNVDIVGFSVSDRFMNCRIRLLDNVFDAGKNGKKDPLYMAIHIMNSEVGFSSINMFLVVYRQVCTNGLIREESNLIYKQKHIGSAGSDKWDEISDKLTYAFELAQNKGKGMLEEFSETQLEQISSPMENIRYLSRLQGYSQKFTSSVEQNFLEEKDSTRYGLINAFTASARDLEDDKRLEVEKFAGELMYKNLLK